MPGVPVVHFVHYRTRLMDDDIRPLGHGLKITVGYHGSDLDNMVAQGIQPGHFQVDPNQS